MSSFDRRIYIILFSLLESSHNKSDFDEKNTKEPNIAATATAATAQNQIKLPLNNLS